MSGRHATHVAEPALATRLIALMHDVTERRLEGQLDDAARPLRELPIDSRTMTAFLVAVEDEFNFEWDIDTPPEVFFSFDTLASHMQEDGLAG